MANICSIQIFHFVLLFWRGEAYRETIILRESLGCRVVELLLDHLWTVVGPPCLKQIIQFSIQQQHSIAKKTRLGVLYQNLKRIDFETFKFQCQNWIC